MTGLEILELCPHSYVYIYIYIEVLAPTRFEELRLCWLKVPGPSKWHRPHEAGIVAWGSGAWRTSKSASDDSATCG